MSDDQKPPTPAIEHHGLSEDGTAQTVTFEHQDQDLPEDRAAQVRAFRALGRDEQDEVLAGLYFQVERSDSKSASAFRASMITLWSVIVAVIALAIAPNVGTLLGGVDSTASDIASLERQKDATFSALHEYVKEARGSSTPVDPVELNRLYSADVIASGTYWDAVIDSGWRSARAWLTIVGSTLALIVLTGLWFRQRTAARRADTERATAAAWIRIYERVAKG